MLKSENNITLRSHYSKMRDGVRLALSEWLHINDDSSERLSPAVLVLTRYWRVSSMVDSRLENQAYTPWAEILIDKGYRLVVADARGTGASFGNRNAEVDSQEVQDIGELIQWVAKQPWCDGRVATHGTSYSGITTLYSLATAPKALKLGICRAPDFDMYRHLIAPGGIVNHWFVKHWGAYTAALDANDVQAMFACGYVQFPQQSEQDSMLGVLPIDDDIDGALLTAAVQAHNENFNLAEDMERLNFIDGFLSDKNPGIYDPVYRDIMDQSDIPLIIRCGWHDAATALGALSLFSTFTQLPVQVILGPFNHEGTYIVDPFQEGDGTNPEKTPLDEGRAWRIDALCKVFDPPVCGITSIDGGESRRYVHYYTLGVNRWKKTAQWPLPETTMERLYFDQGHRLTAEKPSGKTGSDHYQVNLETTTGRFNRWHAQAADQPVYFTDRQGEDTKLLVYDTEPLQKDTELTGHPVVTLWLRSSETDGQFFVYLETVDPDGRVRLLTEGQLRGIHRKVSSDTVPYRLFGPHHSLKQVDAEDMIPGQITGISFDLLPLSVLLKRGQRVRVAIAGADCDTFSTINLNTDINIERNGLYASFIDLPVVDCFEGSK